MIRYLKNSQIDRNRWDHCIAGAPNGIIYAYSWYLDIACKGWDALVKDDYTAVMPVTRGRKYLMDYIFPPFFVQQLGVFSLMPISESLCIEMISAIPSAYRFIEMNLHTTNQWVPGDFTIKKNRNVILSLNRDYQEIRSGYSENHVRNIKKAQKSNFQIFKSGKSETAIKMFRENRGKLIANLNDEHYAILKMLVEETTRRERCRIWIVNDENGLPCAGAIFFESHQSGIMIFSGVTKKGREHGAMHFLIDAYISEFHSDLALLDFEGSNDPELARFYKGFGSSEYVYLQIKKNHLPLPWKLFKN